MAGKGEHEHTYGRVGEEIRCVDKGCGAPVDTEDIQLFQKKAWADQMVVTFPGGRKKRR